MSLTPGQRLLWASENLRSHSSEHLLLYSYFVSGSQFWSFKMKVIFNFYLNHLFCLIWDVILSIVRCFYKKLFFVVGQDVIVKIYVKSIMLIFRGSLQPTLYDIIGSYRSEDFHNWSLWLYLTTALIDTKTGHPNTALQQKRICFFMENHNLLAVVKTGYCPLQTCLQDTACVGIRKIQIYWNMQIKRWLHRDQNQPCFEVFCSDSPASVKM